MHLKMILSTILLVLIVVGFIHHGYTVYVIHNDAQIDSSTKVLSLHGWLVYGLMGIHLLQFVTAGFMVYKS